MIWKDEYDYDYEDIFYVTGGSAGIKHGCVTPLYC
jgi:hypothetical protein